MSTACRVCRSDNTAIFMELGLQPNTMSLLKEGQEEQLLDLTLSYCKQCGLVFIAECGQREEFYDYVQMPTSKFPAEHIEEEIDEITANHLDDPSDMILEIACNDGHFLNLLRERGYGNLFGIEPSVPASDVAIGLGLNVRNTYFSKEVAEEFVKEHGQPKLIVCRHVLEHVEDLDSFTEGLSILMAEDTTLFLEVPDFGRVSRRADFCCIWEQHVNYFDVESLRHLFARFGIDIVKHRTVPFSGGSLITTSRLSADVRPDTAVDQARIAGREELIKRMQAGMDEARNLLKGLKEDGKRIAGFGAGARCSAFLNFARTAEFIDYIVDEDDRKFGLFLPKSRLEISPTSRLLEDPVDYCVVLPFNSKLMEAKVMAKYQDFVDAGGRFIETLADKDDDTVVFAEIR